MNTIHVCTQIVIVFSDILNDFIEIYNPAKLQCLKLISFVITLIGHRQNGCSGTISVFTRENWATQHRA